MMTYSEMEREINEIPKFGAKASLSNLSDYLELANHPERNLRVIHIAGTNGKGSVSAYIDSILRQAGYTTALFTSPHLVKINERFRINFKECSDEELILAWCQVKSFMEKGEKQGLQPLTFFEILFLMGMILFSQKEIDYCILETGLGGRLDATVLSDPVLSIITSISYDHMEILGDTIEKIAAEKAGIIKNGIPVVAVDEENGAFPVIERTAKEKKSPVYGLKSQDLTILKKYENKIDFSINSRYYKISNLKVKSYASYQVQNAALAALAAKCKSISQPGAAVGTVAEVTGVRFTAIWCRVLLFQTQPLGQRVRFLPAVHNVEFRIAVFAGGIFEVVNGLDDADDHKYHAEEAKERRCAHRGGRCRPDDAEDGSEQGADGTHGRGAPARLDAFHGSSSISLRCFSVYHESLPGAMGLYRKQRP